MFSLANSASSRPEKQNFGPFLGFDLGLFALKNQFVFSISKS